MSEEDSDSDMTLPSVGLSAATLAALKEFSLESGLDVAVEADDEAALKLIAQHFDVTEKEEIFHFKYEPESTSSEQPIIEFSVAGASRHRGQTLASSGLTIWRAAEHLAKYLYLNPELVTGKCVCELGAGLGVVSILLEKLNCASRIVCTDGDDDTIVALRDNLSRAECRAVEVEKLYWGEWSEFKLKYALFDIIVAADVIYEEGQVIPMLSTVKEIMQATGMFILAFARRNVKMDDVLEVAKTFGLRWTILDPGLNAMEPIYLFQNL